MSDYRDRETIQWGPGHIVVLLSFILHVPLIVEAQAAWLQVGLETIVLGGRSLRIIITSGLHREGRLVQAPQNATASRFSLSHVFRHPS